MDEELSECIERGISSFGNTVSTIIFWHCRFNSRLDKKEIPQNPELFEKNVRLLFGDSAPSIIRTVAKEIRVRFDLKPEECLSVVAAVHAARQRKTLEPELLNEIA